MNERAVINLIPYIVSFLISTGLGLYAWQRRRVSGALPFALLAWTEAFWTFGYMGELLGSRVETKVFWDNVQWIPTFVGPLALLAFALDYTGQRMAHSRLVWRALFVLAGVWVFILFAYPQHELVRPEVRLVTGTPFSILLYDFSPLVWAMSLYSYAIFALALMFLIGYLIQAQPIYRVQIGVILLGVCIPLAGTLLTLMDISVTANRDNSPFTFAVGNLIVAWGLFRHRLFDLVPVARNLVVDSISDMVVVLDSRRRVVDLNVAAQRVLQSESGTVIGLPARQVFGNWPELVARFEGVQPTHVEIEAPMDGSNRHFDLRISALHDRTGSRTGTVIVIRDISERKRTEHELEQYREHLEELVEQRTADLLTARTALFQERQRLARELHDSVTQTVFAANTLVEILPRVLDRDVVKAGEYIVELRQLTRGAMAELRALMIELRPAALAQTELGVLIKQLCDVFTGNTRVDVAFYAPQKVFLPEPTQVAFYRVAQEALNNIARHAHATAVSVHLIQHGYEVELRVEDNGPGFDPRIVVPDQTGIQSMQGHAQSCGAVLLIVTHEGKGTIVKLTRAVDDG
jgi:PAS domain S-box-containing protein